MFLLDIKVWITIAEKWTGTQKHSPGISNESIKNQPIKRFNGVEKTEWNLLCYLLSLAR